jgi:raffinose/stachyose/melibiose transport system substrate-binding protein
LYFTIPGPVSESWLEQDEITRLDGLVDADRFVPSARDGCSSGGDLVCVPMYISPGFMYYNVDMFEDAGVDPSNWADPLQPTREEFLAAGEALKEAGHVPLAVGNADNWPGLFYYWAAHDRYGGVQTLWDAIEGRASFEHESFVKAGEFVQDLVDRGFFPEGVNGISGEGKYTIFTNEIGAIIYMGTWMTGRIKDQAREDFEWGIFHFPSFPDGNPESQSDIMSGTDGIWLSSECPHPEAAVEYMNAFIDLDTQLWYLEETGNIPSVAGVVEAAKEAGMESPAMMLGEASEDAAHMFPWWDWALAQPMTEEMLSMSQGLLDKSITPEEFGQRLEALR